MIDRDNNGIDDRVDLLELARKAMRERDFLTETPADARGEAERLPSLSHLARARSAKDLTDLLWTSIDNEDSRDLDQLEVTEELDRGVVRLRVAIADVDAYAPDDSALDRAARQNSTSIYTAGGVFPMLDRVLSEEATSLLPGETRLSMVTELDIAPDGAVLRSDHYPAVVRNWAKLDYLTVGPWLEGQGPMPEILSRSPDFARQVTVQDGLAQALRERRIAQGALGLDNAEPRAVRDANGRLVDVAMRRQNRANQLVESLMIAVNQAVARNLDARGYPTLRRAVKTPARWDRIVELAASYDYKLPPVPSPAALAAFLKVIRDERPAEFSVISLSVIKLVGRGEYIAKAPDGPAPGHFGLALDDYAHSTAPNRRYPDVLTQRLLAAMCAGRSSPYDYATLNALGAHCSEREQMAKKVERKVQKSAAALLIADRVGDFFNGVVTGASDKGVWVRVERPTVEGRLSRGASGLDVGDRVRVRLLSYDVEQGFIDFGRA
jgi:VacB/RNase II family 3'-5' exoribonuclease